MKLCQKGVKETIKIRGKIPAFVKEANTLGIEKSSFNKKGKLKIACCCEWMFFVKEEFQRYSRDGTQEQLCKQKCVQNPTPVKILGANNELLATVTQTGKDNKVGYKNKIQIPKNKP